MLSDYASWLLTWRRVSYSGHHSLDPAAVQSTTFRLDPLAAKQPVGGHRDGVLTYDVPRLQKVGCRQSQYAHRDISRIHAELQAAMPGAILSSGETPRAGVRAHFSHPQVGTL